MYVRSLPFLRRWHNSCGKGVLFRSDARIDITLANLSILKTGKARAIRFTTLEAICRILQCQPGDLLQFQSDADVQQSSKSDRAA